VLTLSLIDAKPSPTVAHLSTWIVASVIEALRLVAFILSSHGIAAMDGWNVVEVTIGVTRLVFLLALIHFYILFTLVGKNGSSASSVDETTSLLSADRHANGSLANGHLPNGQRYGATRSEPHLPSEEDDDQPGWARPDKTPSRSWWEYIRGYSIFFPYLWPSKDRSLQLIVVLCFGLVILQRGINVLVPYQIGVITDSLTAQNGDSSLVPWQAILLYIFYRVLQGSNGLIGTARSILWIPVSQYSYRELSVASFEHVHSLSLDFHLGKKTGEVLSALGKGSSINTFLDQVTFQVLPMIIDLTVAIGYFLVAFDAYYALVVAVMTFWYIYITIGLARWRADARRAMVKCDRQQDAVK
jgi:ATP-binding cassette, subfamily B, vacuolar membrane transporter HMT1/ACLQ